jgi:hypothetical protein
MFSKCFEHVVRVIKKNNKNARMAGNIYKVLALWLLVLLLFLSYKMSKNAVTRAVTCLKQVRESTLTSS